MSIKNALNAQNAFYFTAIRTFLLNNFVYWSLLFVDHESNDVDNDDDIIAVVSTICF